MGCHDISAPNHGHADSSHEDNDKSYLWKCLVVVGGIYGLFLFETLTHFFFPKSLGSSHSIEVNYSNSFKLFSLQNYN